MVSSSATDGFALQHEIFVLDTHLQEALPMDNHREITINLVQKLLDVLGMERLGDMQIYPALDMRAPGWSFIQPITTSHISGHYFEKPGRLPHIRLDVYSCEAVNWKNIIKVAHEHLVLADWRATFIHREIELHDNRVVLEIAGLEDNINKEHHLYAPAEAAANKVKQEQLKETVNY